LNVQPINTTTLNFSSNSSSSFPVSDQHIVLQCISVGNRLRVRIISPGYQNNLNCSFPKNIRVDGQLYYVSKMM
jgi:hypothetical protein